MGHPARAGADGESGFRFLGTEVKISAPSTSSGQALSHRTRQGRGTLRWASKPKAGPSPVREISWCRLHRHPPVENHDGWGSLSCDDAHKNQSWASPPGSVGMVPAGKDGPMRDIFYLAFRCQLFLSGPLTSVVLRGNEHLAAGSLRLRFPVAGDLRA